MVEDSRTVAYDKISRVYDISRSANSETIERLIRLLNATRNSFLLDMGCGTGNYAAALQQVAGNVTGIDISMSMIQQAQAKFPSLWLVCGDATHLPFDSETFDGAFAVQVLHHVRDKEAFLREANRVIKKQACIAIHSCSHKQMQTFWFYHYFPKGLELDLRRIPDAKEIASLLEKAGFSNIGIDICYNDVVVADETPESYLNRNYRNGISTFALLTEEDIESGCKKLQADIASGAIESVVRRSEARVAGDVGGSCIIYGRKN